MKINLTRDALCGAITVPRGEYWVSLNHEAGEMTLSAGGKDLRIKATRRRAQGRTRRTTIIFASGGGRIWSLAINTPKYGEWVAFMEYQS